MNIIEIGIVAAMSYVMWRRYKTMRAEEKAKAEKAEAANSSEAILKRNQPCIKYVADYRKWVSSEWDRLTEEQQEELFGNKLTTWVDNKKIQFTTEIQLPTDNWMRSWLYDGIFPAPKVTLNRKRV